MSTTWETEVQQGERFEFGKNWRGFLATLNPNRIQKAEDSIKEMLGVDNLEDKTVLDIGSGSGLFSLAARNLKARVHSLDYDPSSVSCGQQLRAKFFPNDSGWVVERGSVLDDDYLNSLGQYDVVYSWGVLHHTGEMWNAIDNASRRVKDRGTFFIAIYNEQGLLSTYWKMVKAIYCSGFLGKGLITGLFIPYYILRSLAKCVVTGTNVFAEYRENRGMSIYHDWIDWLGGRPFEVAKVEEIFHFLRERGFELRNIKTTNSLGNNQFVFERTAAAAEITRSKAA